MNKNRIISVDPIHFHASKARKEGNQASRNNNTQTSRTMKMAEQVNFQIAQSI